MASPAWTRSVDPSDSVETDKPVTIPRGCIFRLERAWIASSLLTAAFSSSALSVDPVENEIAGGNTKSVGLPPDVAGAGRDSAAMLVLAPLAERLGTAPAF